MKKQLALLLAFLMAGTAQAQQPGVAEGSRVEKKSDFTTMMDSLSNMLSATNPETAKRDNSAYVEAQPAAGENSLHKGQSQNIDPRVNNLPPLVQPPQEQEKRIIAQPIPVQPVAEVPIPPKPTAVAIPQIIDDSKLSPETQRIMRSAPSGVGNQPKSARGLISVQRGEFDKEYGKYAEEPAVQEDEAVAPAKPKFEISVENARNSDSVVSVLEQAIKAVNVGQYESAVALYKQALKRDPKNRDGLFGLALAYHKSGKRSEAREAYGKLLKAYPKYEAGLNNMLVFASEESPKQALAELDRFALRSPGFAPIYAQKGAIYIKLGDKVNARKNLQKAVEMEPGNLGYKYNLAVLLDEMGDTQGAIKLYSQLLEASAKGRDLPADRQQVQERVAYLQGSSY